MIESQSMALYGRYISGLQYCINLLMVNVPKISTPEISKIPFYVERGSWNFTLNLLMISPSEKIW